MKSEILGEKIPNLFIVGEPRSGTTALYNFLSQHPDIFMSFPKEPNYFCKDLHEKSDKFHEKEKKFYKIRDKKEYLKLFEDAENEKIIGEASVNYLFSESAAKEINNFNPDAKIIIILREPSDFIHSLHNEFLNTNIENITNIKKSISLIEKRKKGKFIPRGARDPSYLLYTEWTKYHKQIKRYLDLFNKNQIKVVIYDDFKKDNLKIYKEILEFLDVNENFIPKFEIINASKVPKSRFINKIIKDPLIVKMIENLIPYKFYCNLKIKINNLLMRKTQLKNKEENSKKEFMKIFKEDVFELNELLKTTNLIDKERNLIKEWGYNEI